MTLGRSGRTEDHEISTDEINLVVAQLKRITRSVNLEFALRVGALIIHHVYGGDMDALRSRGAKTLSFRRLAEHPQLPMSAGTLYRCVAIFELCDRFNAPARWEHLGTSHLRTVLGLPPAVQERLLSTANERRMTVKELHAAIGRENSARLTRKGRRARSPIMASLQKATAWLAEHRRVVAQMKTIPGCDIEQSLRVIEEAQRGFEELSRSLRALNGAEHRTGATIRPLPSA